MTGMTLSEKIIARAAGLDTVRPGDEVWASADRILMNDSGGPRRIAPLIEELDGLRDREQVVLVSDHFMPPANLRHAEILKVTREWAAEQQIPHFYEAQGILHNLVLEEKLVLPGMLVVGSDSHTVTAGAVGAVALSVGSTELATVLATGELWLQVPDTVQIVLEGALPTLIDIRDITMHILGRLKTDFAVYRAVEYGGTFLETLDLEERIVLSNQGIEMGATNAIVPPHGSLVDDAMGPTHPDSDADYVAVHTIDVTTLTPQVALPHMVDNVISIEDAPSTAVSAAWIGSCVGGRYADLKAAAHVLQGRKAKIPLIITPATHAIYQHCLQDGTLQTLVAAGAIIHPAGCGACAGLHSGTVAAGEKIITTATRNFKGRMGSQDSEVYLASPFTVAASAVAGRIVDPHEVGVSEAMS
jgi:3-isopropylmalate/(R)-2-methylmalate dehydratase large subunit